MFDRRAIVIGSAGALAASAAASVLPSTAATAPIRMELREDGLVGRFHATTGSRSRPAVIMLNGSDGGIPSSVDADDLAKSGYPTLALAYFKDWRGQPEGVPPSLNEIPLEYFFRAIEWLKRRPEVDARRIVLMGQSRGGELALLLASHRADVAGVIAFSPSSRVWGGLPPYGAPPAPTRPAWTLDGDPVPFQDAVGQPGVPMRKWFDHAKPVESARISVERIRGPVLLVSSSADTVWPSDVYSDEIAAKLATRPRGAAVTNLRFEDAGHLLMGTGPGVTKMDIPGTKFSFDFGGTPEGTARARAEAWAASKRLLASF